ncbi:MAG: adenine-specific methyltransferase EcoRI family protein [Muribaculum sp.]|nr:adenine-specific methyltransferase EcoRI family protein [Muribaculaceae bacterium]MCM1081504.1 adenine-specific methyltransferase EcoRI family protein [Muribaculum sp.]
MANKNLNKAKEAKKDEFYTQLEDINNELRHYREHFRGKTVLCNCDDPRVSNFFKYFAYNFEFLGLKKLIATCYKNQDVNLFSEGTSEQAVYLVYEGDKNGNHIPDDEEIEVLPLKGDGDFRSAECIEFLKEADIVVTNPPFSLFREYVAQLIKYDKKFLIIGPYNAISYKEIFPIIMKNKMWLGFGFNSGNAFFKVPEPSIYAEGVYNENTGLVKFRNCCWFTNLDHRKRHEDLILYKTFSNEEYPKYINYDAIEISKTELIPMDYMERMGVPITFLDKYNPNQFEIIGMANGGELGVECGVSSNLSSAECDALFREDKTFRKGKVCYRDKNGKLKGCYARIIIRRKR